MTRSIIIVGAGLGGLASGCYGQINGYETRIFEQHILPGGQCTSWKRKGYTFDVCIHHFFGASPASRLYSLWQELGVMPCPLVRPDDCVSVVSPDGRLFTDFYDLDKLESHLLSLSPADQKPIREYIRAIRLFSGKDLMGKMVLGSLGGMLAALASRPAMFNYFGMTMRKFAQKFSDPFLKGHSHC